MQRPKSKLKKPLQMIYKLPSKRFWHFLTNTTPPFIVGYRDEVVLISPIKVFLVFGRLLRSDQKGNSSSWKLHLLPFRAIFFLSSCLNTRKRMENRCRLPPSHQLPCPLQNPQDYLLGLRVQTYLKAFCHITRLKT